MMKRRALVGAGGLWMLERPALAQPARKVYRIGLAATGSTSDLAGPQPGGAAAQAFLRFPPSNQLEALKGQRKGQWSIRINAQWRICFRFDAGDCFDLEIIDYH